MGLDTTHDCWHGAYSAFHRWRIEIARVEGIPLELMAGYYSDDSMLNLHRLANVLANSPFDMFANTLDGLHRILPISWDLLKPDILYVLLHHSDCEGELPADVCGPLADRLEELLPRLSGDFGGHVGDIREKTQKFIDGLRLAASRNEPVEFH